MQNMITISSVVCYGGCILTENPPLSSADSELVLDFGARLGRHNFLEDELASLAGIVFHLHGFPLRIGEGTGNEEWRLRPRCVVRYRDRNLGGRHAE